MTKYLPFKTNQRSVAQIVFIWQRFEEKLSFFQDPILRFSVHIFKGQPMLKELSNLNGMTIITLLGLVRSHFLQNFWLLKKLLFYQDLILRFSVQTFKGQHMFKELSNLNGLTKIILLGLVRSHFLQVLLNVEKIEGCGSTYRSQII